MKKSFKFIYRVFNYIETNGQRFLHVKDVDEFAKCNASTLLCQWSHRYAPVSTFNSKITFPDNVRTYKRETDRCNNSSTNVQNTLTDRKSRAMKIRQSIQYRQQKLKKEVEDALFQKRAKFANTGRQIRARGKLIIQDIKETKNKMREKMEEVIEKENVYTIPNLLCVIRITTSPLLGYFIISENFVYALGFMVVAGISDWADGYIARKFRNQSSKIGSFLDPAADKILIGTLFLSLTYVNLIPVPLTALIIARDLVLVGAGFVIRYRSLPPPRTLSRYFDVTLATAQLAPTFISKVNTGVQLMFVASTLAAPVFGYVDHPILQCLCYVTAVSTILSAASYISSKETYRYLRNKKHSKWNK